MPNSNIFWMTGIDPDYRPEVAESLDKFAQLSGLRVVVTDGVRPENAPYGAKKSLHKKRLAVDVKIKAAPMQVYEWAKSAGFTGFLFWKSKDGKRWGYHLDRRDLVGKA